MKSIVILYHSKCLDGFSAAWVAHKKFGNKAQYIPVEHQTSPPRGLKNKEIYLLDFSYSASILKRFMNENKKVTIIDHHISAQKDAAVVPGSILDLNHSGSVLTWKSFYPKKAIPKLLRYIENGDLWQFKMPFVKEILAWLDLQSLNFANWNKIARGLENPKIKKEYIQRGKTILEYQQRVIKSLVSRAQKVKFEGYKTLAVNSPILGSEIGHALYSKFPPMSIIWHQKGEGKIKVSLRSNGKLDVAELAGRYGGGGHKAASGFTLKVDQKFPWKLIG